MPSAERSSGVDARPDLEIIDASHRFGSSPGYKRHRLVIGMEEPQEDLSIFEDKKNERYKSSPSPITPEDVAEARAILGGTDGSRISLADRVKSWFGRAKETKLEISLDHKLPPEDEEVKAIVAKLTAPREKPDQEVRLKPNPQPVRAPKPV